MAPLIKRMCSKPVTSKIFAPRFQSKVCCKEKNCFPASKRLLSLFVHMISPQNILYVLTGLTVLSERGGGGGVAPGVWSHE